MGVPGLLNGEHLSGALPWLFDSQGLVPSFEAMNIVLAARVRLVASQARRR